MNKNVVLKFTTFIFSIGRVITALSIFALILLGTAAFFTEDFGAGMIFETGHLIFDRSGEANLGLSEYASTKPFQFVFSLLQNIVILFLVFKILGKLLKITRSIDNLKTFALGNAKAFHDISIYAFLIFCIQIIKILPEKISLGIHFEPLVAAALAFILSEVFKEGHQLMEDNELTV
jgi:hypothetical protein